MKKCNFCRNARTFASWRFHLSFIDRWRRAKPQSSKISVNSRCHRKLISSEAKIVAMSCKFLNLIFFKNFKLLFFRHWIFNRRRCIVNGARIATNDNSSNSVCNSIIKLRYVDNCWNKNSKKTYDDDCEMEKRLSSNEFELFYSCWGFTSARTWTESENLFIFQFIRIFIFSKIYRHCTESNMSQRDATNRRELAFHNIHRRNLRRKLDMKF